MTFRTYVYTVHRVDRQTKEKTVVPYIVESLNGVEQRIPSPQFLDCVGAERNVRFVRSPLRIPAYIEQSVCLISLFASSIMLKLFQTIITNFGGKPAHRP